ncbi:MAG: signal peptidase I [archaeon GB-1845-036]|nr:signal peptidase I [Candidatus Culexmicrobium thermophilum]
MKIKALFLLSLILFIQIFLNLYHPPGLLSYIIPSLCWGLIGVLSILLWGLPNIFKYVNLRIVKYAFLLSIIQLALSVDLGLFNSFAKNPVVFTPTMIVINLTYVLALILGMEFSRGFIIKFLCGRRKTFLILALSLIYSPTFNLFETIFSGQKPIVLVDFLGSSFLPSLASNMFASYLVSLSGPAASISYVAPLKLFNWFSPFLPSLPWGLTSLLGVGFPIVSFTVLENILPKRLRRKSILKVKDFRNSSFRSILPFILFVLVIWFNLGFFNVFPSVVMSGSMRPEFDVGDVLLLLKVSSKDLNVGDIVQYVSESRVMVVHRIVDFKGIFLITKGDANVNPDPVPVHPDQVLGKVILIIPKIGWFSIYVRSMFNFIFQFIGKLHI